MRIGVAWPWLSAVVGAMAGFDLVACGKTTGAHEHPHETTAASDKQTDRGSHADDRGHDHGVGDLDRSVEELFAASCEHHRKTFECDECRYEVGVVRASPDLVSEGLFAIEHTASRPVAHGVELNGEVQFDDRLVAHVSPPAEGLIRKVHVMVGNQVKKGAPLVEIESVRASDAHGEVLEAEARLRLAEQFFERADSLRNRGLSSEKDHEEARVELESAKIRASAARERLQRLGGTNGGTIVLRAPVDGSVLVLHAVPGEFVASEAPVATVGNNASVWVWADLYDQDIAPVMAARRAGPIAAAVRVKAYPGTDFPGVVDFISPVMDRDTRTVKTRIQLGNTDGRLLAGMFATVVVYLPGEEKALALPRDAVLHDEGQSFVFVHHHENYYVRRRVEPGRAWARWVEVKSGVTAADRIVSRGAFLMKSDVLRSKMGAGCAD